MVLAVLGKLISLEAKFLLLFLLLLSIKDSSCLSVPANSKASRTQSLNCVSKPRNERKTSNVKLKKAIFSYFAEQKSEVHLLSKLYRAAYSSKV